MRQLQGIEFGLARLAAAARSATPGYVHQEAVLGSFTASKIGILLNNLLNTPYEICQEISATKWLSVPPGSEIVTCPQFEQPFNPHLGHETP